MKRLAKRLIGHDLIFDTAALTRWMNAREVPIMRDDGVVTGTVSRSADFVFFMGRATSRSGRPMICARPPYYRELVQQGKIDITVFQ